MTSPTTDPRAAAPAGAAAPVRGELPRQAAGVRTPRVVGALVSRSMLSLRRMPVTFVPTIVMPVFFTIVFSGAFSAITRLPGFATDNILSWYMPMAVIQGAAFSGITTGFGVARDMETGFFDRLLLAPVPRLTLTVGALVAGLVRATITTTVVLIVGLVGGAAVPGGVTGLLMLYVAALGVSVVAGLWGLGLVYRAGSTTIGPVIQVGIFTSIFLSTAQVPLSAMEGTWLHPVARLNPMTQVLDLARSGFLGGVGAGEVWPGLAALAGAAVVLGVFATRGLARAAGR